MNERAHRNPPAGSSPTAGSGMSEPSGPGGTFPDSEWSWVGEDGIEHPCTEAELTFSLSSEEIPVYTLVWKQGWPEWLPAMQVAELAWALPAGTADMTQKPAAVDSGSRHPPPLDLYPEYRRRAQDIASGRINLQAQVASSPSATSSQALGGSRREQTPGPSRVQAATGDTASSVTGYAPVANLRDLLPFSREDEDEPTVQVDPEALARERMLSLLDVEVDSMPVPGDSAAGYYPQTTTPTGSEGNSVAATLQRFAKLKQPFQQTRSPAHLAARPLTEPPQAIQTLPTPSAPSASPIHSTGQFATRPPSAPSYAPRPIEPEASGAAVLPPTEPGAAPSASRGFPFFLIAAALALGAVGALWLRSETPNPSVAPPPPAPPQPPPPIVSIPSCRVGQTGTLLAEWVYSKIEPTVTSLAGSNKVAIGYAQTSRFAVGVSLDPESMRVEKLFSEFQNSPLLSVTPMTQIGALSYRTTRAAATLQSSTALNLPKPFAFGWTRDGFAIRRDTAAQDEILWKSAFTTANVPSVARFDNTSLLFAIRAGGERGSLLLGKLLDSGTAGSELLPVKFPEGRLGVPALRVGQSFSLVTFTLGNSELRGDVYLANAALPKIPDSAQLVYQTREGVFSPEAVELSPQSFVLQFTRGEPGNQQVVAQTYQLDGMRKQGNELLISPSNVDAHSGSLWRLQKGFLSLYSVHTDQGTALWGSRIDCD